jgi:hypothetical protein
MQYASTPFVMHLKQMHRFWGHVRTVPGKINTIVTLRREGVQGHDVKPLNLHIGL